MHSFEATVSQMSILTLYNDALEYSVDSIGERLKMSRDALIPLVQSLVKLELLKMAASGADAEAELDAQSSGDTRLQLNMQFSK